MGGRALADEVIDGETRTVNTPTSYSGDLDVGASGTGALTISDGGTVSNRNGTVGHFVDSSGTVTVTGAGSTWTNTLELVVGWSGRGKMTISDGGTVTNTEGFIGARDGGSGTVTVTGSGSTWDCSSQLIIGFDASTGELIIENGGTVINTSGRIGLSANSVGTVTVTGANSTLTDNGPFLRVGYDGTGTLTITDGGLVTVGTQTNGAYNGTLTLASNAGSTGTLNIGAAAGSSAATAGTFKAASVAFGSGTGTIVFNHTSSDFTFSPAITTLNSSSSGTIEALAGATTLNGDVSGNIDLTVSGGSLTIASSSYSGRSLAVSSGAGLALASGNAVTLSGAYVQTGGSLIINNGSKVLLTGTSGATVSNTAITYYGTGLSAGSSYVLVDTNAASSYIGDTLSLRGAHGLVGELSTADNGHDLIVTITANSYNMIGSGQSTSMGSTLDALASRTDLPTDMSSILDAIDTLSSTTTKASAIKQLSPSQTTPSAQMSNTAATVVLGAVEQHQQTAMSYDPATGKAAGSDAYRNALWGQALGGGAIRDSSGSTDGFRMKEFGLASGVDHMFSDNLMGGIALSWMRTYSSGSDGSATNSTLDSYMLTSYGTYREGPLFFNGQMGMGYNQFHQKREIGFLNRKATADYGGEQYLLRAQTGYDIPLGDDGVKVTPLAGLTFLHTVSDAYTESGAGSAGLSVLRQGVEGLNHDIGAKLGWALDTGWGRLKPEVRAEWVHDYRRSAVNTSGSLDGAAFASATPRLSQDGAQIGVAATLDGPDAVSFRAEYAGETRPDYQSHTGMVKVIWGF